MDVCRTTKYVFSSMLLIFCIAIIVSLIFNERTTLSRDVHPLLAYFTILCAVLWLAMVEGGQGSLVGLAPVDGDLFKDSRNLAYKCTSLAHKGDNLDRYLMGRQFMVVLLVFAINLAGGPVAGAELWDLPKVIRVIFLDARVALIITTCIIGQLHSQISSCHYMLDYLNNYFALFTIYVAMAIEFSGLLHCSYLVQMIVAHVSGNAIESQEEPRNLIQHIFFYARCIMSVVALVISILVTLGALFEGKTTAWDGIPEGVSVIMFFMLMCVVGILEGMQIAFFAVTQLPSSKRGKAQFAKKTCELLFSDGGRNLPGFMVGRQICVVSAMFIAARITTLNVDTDAGDPPIFGVSDGLQTFFNTGLLGALITTIVGSISWQLVASAFPVAFLSNPLVYGFLRFCLMVESTGVLSAAWLLAGIHKRLANFQLDEVYIGTAEERAAKNKKDASGRLRTGPGRPRKLPGFSKSAPETLVDVMKMPWGGIELDDSTKP